jgi:ABC-type transport system involved in multi-copper enzyme maturation permease subunit
MRVPYIAWLTFREARRRRLLLVGLLLGAAFLILYGVAFYFLYRDVWRANQGSGALGLIEIRELSSTFTMMGLYAVNFLVVMVTVLTSVDTISGEIASHSIQSIVTKPLARWEVVLGKWLGYALMVSATVLLLAGGVMLISFVISGFVPDNLVPSLLLMMMVGWVLLTLTILGGTLFSTITNGVVVFMLFILGFMGGWTEQIGAAISNQTAINIGIISSLLMPTEALWRLASSLMQPSSLTDIFNSPFVSRSVPSPAMVVYAVLYTIVALGGAAWVFQQRDL